MAAPLRAWAVIVAGGSGTRFGRRKQFARLAGRPVVAWSIDAARTTCEGVVVVVPAALSADGVFDPGGGEPGDEELAVVLRDTVVVCGGDTRSSSVRAGLAAVPAEAEVIAVHDAARPLAGPALWHAVLDAVRAGADGAVPVVAVPDTIRRIGEDGSVRAVDRDALRRAHADATDATDDATLVEAQGGHVVLVDGHAANAKITGPHDLIVAEALLREVLTC